MRLKLNRTMAGYILVGIAMLLICLYLRFPGEALKEYMKGVAAQYPQSWLSIDKIGPSFPPGLVLANITWGFHDHPEATLHLDDLRIRAEGVSLIRGRLAIILAARGYGGEARGRVDFPRLFSLDGPLHTETTLRDVRIEKCAWLQETLARQVTGTLQGNLSLNGTMETLKSMTGDIDFTLTNGAYPLIDGFFNMKKIDFSKIEGKFSFLNGTVRITQLALTGEKLRVSLKGNLLIADEFQDSGIDLNGTIEIPALGNKRMTLTIGGTVGNPKTRLM